MASQGTRRLKEEAGTYPAAALGLLVLGILSCAWHWNARSPLPSSDFAIIYRATLESGRRMYAPAFRDLNPPHFHLIVEPFTRLPLHAAAYAWLFSGVVIAAACLWWISKVRQERWSLLDLAALSLWMPTATLLITNEVTWVLWPPLVFAWWCWRRDRWALGAVAFGLALALKPFLGLFAVWLVIRRQWRAAMAAGLTCSAVFGVGAAVYGVDAYRAWVTTLGGITWTWGTMNASVLALLTRVFAPSVPYHPVVTAAGLVRPIWIVAIGIIIGLSLWRSRTQTVESSWVTLMMAALLVSPLGWIYYAWWILPGIRPADVIKTAPMWCVPLLLIRVGQPSGWWTLTWGSAYTWGALALWVRAMIDNSSLPLLSKRDGLNQRNETEFSV